jgi:hypothetical protein
VRFVAILILNLGAKIGISLEFLLEDLFFKILGLFYDKFCRWFKECLSGFSTQVGQAMLHQFDIEKPVVNGVNYKQTNCCKKGICKTFH